MTSPAPVEVLDVKSLKLNVLASLQQVAEFKAITFDKGSGVPVAFAFCWLTLPEVRGRIVSLIGPGRLPLHESQSFEVIEPLIPETCYKLELNFNVLETPPGLEIEGRVFREDGVIILLLQTLLRFVPIAEAVG